tara:strand:- start:156 stop:500 length:345 start_codon:yes stop_codon:yes gene_type:complete
MSADCLFCNIANGDMGTSFFYEDELIVAFEDISPQAPVHMLIIPKKHISTLNELQPEDAELVGTLVLCARNIAEKYSIKESGYRLLFNCNREGGQTVYHLHMHLIGGRQLGALG